MSTRTPLAATDARTHDHPADGPPGSGATSDVVEQVFLSPRVVDRRAFGELATELRRLVERAAGERTGLTAALDQATECTRALRESETGQQDNLELTARALKRLDERIARAQELLSQTSDANKLIERFHGRADEIIGEKIEALEARIEAAQAGAAARVEALEERLRSATRNLEQRIEVMRHDAEGMVGPGLTALNQAVARAAAVLGRSPDDPSEANRPVQPGSLEDLVLRAESASGIAESAVRQLESIQARADGSRSTFGSLLEELSALITRVDTQRAALVEDSRRVCRECTDAAAGLETRLSDTRRQAESAIAEIKPQAQAAAAEATSTLDELRELVRRATDAHNTTTLVLRLADKSGAQINAALAALEPWRKVLIDAEGAAQMPPAIRAIVETVRSEFTTDLSGIAEALRTAAANAQRAAGRAAEVAVSAGAQIAATSGPHAAD